MERTFLLRGLDCANCAAKIQREVGELEGVLSSDVNLLSQTLTIQTEQQSDPAVVRRIEHIVHSHEPHVTVQEKAALQVKKVYHLKGLDCAHCSAMIQQEVGALDGVSSSVVNLLNQTLTVVVEQGAAHQVAREIETIVHSHESHVEVTEVLDRQLAAKPAEETEEDRGRLLRLAVGGVLYAIGLLLGHLGQVGLPVELSILVIAYLILGGDVILAAARNIVQGHVFDENFLMSLSTVGAFAIGEYPEAVAVMLFYQIGEYFQDRAVRRSRKSIADLMDIRPDEAVVERNGRWVTAAPESVAVGEVILVKAGERIPLDGRVLEGTSMLDTQALTGESVPRRVYLGEEALSGCINLSGKLTLQVTKSFGESTVAKILDLVENASSRKAPTENFITTFARYYTPVVVILAALLAVIPPLFLGGVWADWLHRGFVFLVISCPCALVISIPLAFFGGIGAASRHGILVKGSNYLEALNSVDTIVFDKTGTLTKGVFAVTEILPADGAAREEVLAYAATAERFSNHPIARSILEAYGEGRGLEGAENYREVAGQGVSLTVGGRPVLAGSARLLETAGVPFDTLSQPGTKVYVAVDGRYIGAILIADEIKADSKEAIAALKNLGVKETVLLTGDDKTIAASVADTLGVDTCYGELLPDQKVEKLEELDRRKTPGSKLAFVGDGINDAPVLARADIGIAMGGLGSDAAIEAADIVLMTDEPSKLVEAIQVARDTKRIVIQNIVLALGIKGACLVLGAAGLAGMWEAVFADVGVALIAVCNAMRMLKK